MKTIRMPQVVAALICLCCLPLLSGCLQNRPSPAKAASPAATAPSLLPDTPEEWMPPPGKKPYQNGDRYFYFVESQLMRKRGDLDGAVHALEQALALDPGSAYIKRELANLFLRQRKTEKALAVVEGMLNDNPEDISLMILYGKLLQGLKRDVEAEGVYERVLRADPGQKEIYLRLGAIYMEKGDVENAFRIYQSLVREHPDAYAGHFFMGKIYYDQGYLKKAEEQFKLTLSLEPDLEEPRFELINIYQVQGKNRQAIEIYQELLEKEPDNIRAMIGLGYYYHSIGNQKRSDEILSRLGRESAEQPDILRTVIQFYVEQKRFGETAVITEGMLKGMPSGSDLHYIAGIAYDGLKNEKKMLRHLKQVGPESVFYPNAVVSIAFYHQEKGETGTAIEYLEEVNRRVPGNADFILYLATVYEEAKQYERAEKTLVEGIKLVPDAPKLYFRLGVVYDKMERKNDSIGMMKKVIDLDPRNADALNYLGYTYADMGKNLEIAEELIREALKYKPDDGYILDSLGWVYFQRGEYEEALRYLIKAAETVPDDPVILEHVGDAYFRLNDFHNALKFYQRSLNQRDAADRMEIQNKIREAMDRSAALQ